MTPPTMMALALPILLASCGPAAARPHPRRPQIDVQIDPVPFFLRGFAPEAGVSAGAHRGYATVVAYDVPGFLLEDPAFDERRNYRLGLGYQYFFRGAPAGPFVGASALWTHSTFMRADLASGPEHEADTLAAAARVGWVLSPLRAVPALFLGPWISASYAFAPEAFAIEGRQIHRRALGVTGALQLGWRFSPGG
jgi:hypothetical protein